jgi:hypothetical protein
VNQCQGVWGMRMAIPCARQGTASVVSRCGARSRIQQQNV